jgi:hypothetical protein
LEIEAAMSFTPEEVDCGADALRRYEQQRDRVLRLWCDLPSGTKKKWREKASVVLSAVERESMRIINLNE